MRTIILIADLSSRWLKNCRLAENRAAIEVPRWPQRELNVPSADDNAHHHGRLEIASGPPKTSREAAFAGLVRLNLKGADQSPVCSVFVRHYWLAVSLRARHRRRGDPLCTSCTPLVHIERQR